MSEQLPDAFTSGGYIHLVYHSIARQLDRPVLGGGVAVYIPSTYKAKRRNDLENELRLCGLSLS